MRSPRWSADGSPDGHRNHETTHDALEQIVDDALATGARVVIGAPPPFLHTADSHHHPAAIDAFNANLEEVLVPMILAIVEERLADGAAIAFFDAYHQWASLPGWPSASFYEQESVAPMASTPGASLRPE